MIKQQDNNEDAWTEAVDFGEPANGATADQDVVNAAGQCEPSGYYQPDEAVFIPVQITFDLTSVEPVNDFAVDINTIYNNVAIVVYRYRDGTYGCTGPDGGQGDQFDVLESGKEQTATAWVVMTAAYNGQGQPDIAQLTGSGITIGQTQVGPYGKIISATGPDICGSGSATWVPKLLVTGLKPSQSACTDPATYTWHVG